MRASAARTRLLSLGLLAAIATSVLLLHPPWPTGDRSKPKSNHTEMDDQLLRIERRYRQLVSLLEVAAQQAAQSPDLTPAFAGDRAAAARVFQHLEALREKTPERPMLAVRAPPSSTLAWAGRVTETEAHGRLGTRCRVYFLSGGITTTLVAACPILASNGRALGIATAEIPIAVRHRIQNAFLSDFDRLTGDQPGIEIRYFDVHRAPVLPPSFPPASRERISAGALLRAPDGSVLAAVRVMAPLGGPTDRGTVIPRALGVVVLLASVLWGLRRISNLSPSFRLVVAATVARCALLGWEIPSDFVRPILLSSQAFSSPLLGPLTSTPLDLLLSTAWLAFLALLLVRAALSVSARPAVGSGRIAWWSLSVLGLPILTFPFAWIADIGNRCSVDLVTFSLLPDSALRATLQLTSLLILIAAASMLTALLCVAGPFPRDRRGLTLHIAGLVLLGMAGYRLCPRQLIGLPWMPAVGLYTACAWVAGTRDRWRPRLDRATAEGRAVLGAVVVTLFAILLYPSLTHLEEQALRRRMEGDFAEMVLRQPAWRERILAESRRRIDDLKLLQSTDSETAPPPAEELAFTVWSEAGLAAYGLSSAVEIQDAQGRLVSRFALNLPSVSTAVQPLPHQPRWETSREWLRIAGHNSRVLHSCRLVASGGSVHGAIHVYVREDYWHLPFVRARDPYSVLYRGAIDQAARESRLDLIVYDRQRDPVFSSTERPPVLGEELMARLTRDSTQRWTTLDIDGRPGRAFVFADRDHVFVLSYARTSIGRFAADLVAAASAVAVFALGLLLFVVAARTVLRFSTLTFPSLAGAVSRRFTLRLLLVLVAVAIVPLLVLQTVVRDLVADRLRQETETDALQRSAVARKAVEDYVRFRAEEASSDRPGLDAGLVYIASLMRNDLDLFVNGRLLASSKRELYASGLLPSRVSSSAYRALVLHDEPALLAPERIGELSFLTVSVPLRLGGTDPAILSIPLALRQREMESVLQDVDRTIRLVSAIFLTAAALLAQTVARRISGPIRDLTEATRRIARGDFAARVASRSQDELATLVQSFNRMADDLDRQRHDLEHSNRLAAWAEMARQVAHEVKNPLTPIQLSAEHLRRVYSDPETDFSSTLQTCTETILRQVQTLRGIVTEFSAFARSPASPLLLEDVASIAAEAAAPYRAALPTGIRLLLDAPTGLPPARADRRLLERAIVNLLENALHAIGESGSVTLSVRADDRRIAISVEDDGPGIAPDIRDRVFEPFFSTKTGGSGLGLALVRKIAEDHGGGASLTSQPGRTRVTIWLPAASHRPADS